MSRSSRRNNQNRFNWERFKQTIEQNPNTSQFIINSLLVILTFAALIITIIFSNKGISESRKQYIQAQAQLKLAKDQFQYSIDQRKFDSIENIKTQIKTDRKNKSDSIIAEQRFTTQERRNAVQDSINKQQLKAIQLQAKLAALQLKAQVKINNQTFYEERPNFLLVNAKRDSLTQIAYFSIKNIGKRPARIIQSKICAYNHQYQTFFQASRNVGRVLDTVSLYNQSILLSAKTFYDEGTAYYISIQYVDIDSGKQKIFDKYFQWYFQTIDYLYWRDLDKKYISLLRKRALNENFRFSNIEKNKY